MNSSELRDLESRVLVAREAQTCFELAQCRLQNSMGQLDANSTIRNLRRERARIKTVIRAREISEGLAKDHLYRVNASARAIDGSASGGEAPGNEGLLASLKKKIVGEAD